MEIKATPNDVILATTTPKGLKSELGRVISSNSTILNIISQQLAMEGRRDEDVKIIRDMFLEQIGRKNTEEVNTSFLFWFRRFIRTKQNSGTRGVYEQTVRRMCDYDKSLDKRKFEDINFTWLSNFEAFCAATASKNARNIHLRNIRAVFNNAIDNEITTFYPFRRFKIKSEKTRKRAMSVEELRELFSYPVEPYAEIYRDMFKLIFMLIGINTVDLYGLKEIRNGRIEYKRAKTGREYSIKVEPEALEIINKYKGEKRLLSLADRWSDYRNFRHQINNALQSIGAEKNKGGRLPGGRPKKTNKDEKPKGIWPELTTYWARHTWATIARKIGVSTDDIALALGHADENHSTTMIYIDDDLDLIDQANRKVLDWVLYGKPEGQTSE